MGYFIKYKEEKNHHAYQIESKNWIRYLGLLVISGFLSFYLGVSYNNSPWTLILFAVFLLTVVWGFAETIPMWFKSTASSLKGNQITSISKGTLFHRNFKSEIKIEK